MLNQIRTLVAGSLLATAAIACGSSDDGDSNAGGDTGSTPVGVQGEAGLCVDLTLVERALERVNDLDSDSTIAEAEAARDALNLALTEMQQAGNELTTAQSASLQDAFSTFNGLLDSVGSGGSNQTDTLGAAAAPLAASADDISQTVDDISAEASCP